MGLRAGGPLQGRAGVGEVAAGVPAFAQLPASPLLTCTTTPAAASTPHAHQRRIVHVKAAHATSVHTTVKSWMQEAGSRVSSSCNGLTFVQSHCTILLGLSNCCRPISPASFTSLIIIVHLRRKSGG